MDFCQLLHKAQKNDNNTAQGGRYYSTKYEPPKKVKKETKDLSANIKKFLANKEAEEQKKRNVEQKKKEELLALRAQDKKATRRVNVMLKRTKSANQSVLEEAVDNTHTAVTRAGVEQPDEDDYGYVSQEASALYEKMMEKYSQMPEEPKFNMFKKKVSTNLTGTKDRVKAALEKEKEEAMQPHKRKRKKKHEEGQEVEEKKTCDDEDKDSPERTKTSKDSKEKEIPKVKKPRPAAPPPLSFTELLKIAAQKQHEPILIEEKPQEDEKLFTKKQRKEFEKEREWKEKRDRRLKEMEQKERDRDQIEKDRRKSSNSSKSSLKIVPPTTDFKILERQLTKPTPSSTERSQNNDRENKPNNKTTERTPSKQVAFSCGSGPSQKSSSVDSKLTLKSENRHKSSDYKPSKPTLSSGTSKLTMQNGFHKSTVSSKSTENRPSKSSNGTPSSGASRDAVRKGDVPKKGAPSQVAGGKFTGKPKEFPPRDLLPQGRRKEIKPKQFPPSDVRGIKRKPPIVANKGRIIDDDDEDEYDSELDDFIDDEPEEGDYSSYIKEIFGYDKSKYRDVDDDVDNMESSFAQQMREDAISAKLGIMEDQEDIKKEEEHKRRKAIMKKKMRR